MHTKHILLITLSLGTALSAADKLKPNKLKPTPPTTPPMHNSPQTTKKECTTPLLEIPAGKIESTTNQNLESYLHLQQQISDLHAKVEVQTNTLNDALKKHDQYVTKQIQDIMMQPERPMIVNFTNINGDTEKKPLDYAIKQVQQRNEECWEEIKAVKDAHNERLQVLEASQNSMATATLHKSWSRWLMDHFVASALVATGLYHSSAFHSTITQMIPNLLHIPIIKKVLPYIGIPASALFMGTFAADLHHNFQDATFNVQRSSWKRYCESTKWLPFKHPSDLFISTAIIVKTFSDNISHVLTPACKYMLVAGIALAIAETPNI